jgi:hypothetical protein
MTQASVPAQSPRGNRSPGANRIALPLRTRDVLGRGLALVGAADHASVAKGIVGRVRRDDRGDRPSRATRPPDSDERGAGAVSSRWLVLARSSSDTATIDEMLRSKTPHVFARRQAGRMRCRTIVTMDERSARWQRRFSIPVIVAALATVPLWVLEQGNPGEPMRTILEVCDWIVWASAQAVIATRRRSFASGVAG